ncbi:DsbC family protein [Dechloromonas agitata]|uniref:Thiol:disulfide interchange protein n=1 Tax=Dechloromonas agitata TaxID=73030 RepID=A0A930FZ71_9RHOO|nr:DsbC family protein [Dechloromonas agitata]MBF1164535.1 DsbC family protein [Dechloromonas agitata]MDE1544940.1 DsbC family protein [Dechloromonas agitata]
MLKKMLSLTLAMAFSSVAVADEADVKKAMEAKLGAKVESVNKSGYLGLYEVYADGAIFYTDDKVSAIMVGGQMIDAKTMKNVTDERMKKLTAIRFGDLPLDRAIKQVRGDGKRVLATFEDPNCGYCKRLAKEMLKLDNVTVYVFLYPILSEDSVRKSKQIWCSPDRAKAWSEWMVDGKVPAGREDCDTTAITKNQEFGRKLNISGTPTMFFGDGERVPGAIPLARIEQKLNQVK